MLLLNPRMVRFGAEMWQDVSAVVIDRSAARQVVEWSDDGPHVVLADVPEQKVTVRVVQDVASDDVDAPTPGEQGELRFYTSPTAAEGGRRRVSTEAVVLSVTHELSLKKGAVRTVTLVAVSADGATDPISITDSDEGSV